MTIFARFATRQPTVCAVCRRHAVWLGYRPPRYERMPTIWLCDDNYCHAAGREVYVMPKDILDAHELGAMLEAGGIAGEYLDTIGQTDFAKLDAEQWREFLRRLLTGFEHILRRKILNDEPALTPTIAEHIDGSV
jgi:Family of unknown function (DUF6511)